MNRGADTESGLKCIDLARALPFRVAGIEFEPQRRIVRSGGSEILVEPRVMQVLLALARSGGAIVTREELVESCWGGRIIGDDSIHQVVRKIRKLASGFGKAIPIETVRGVGYRLAAEPAAAESSPPPARLRWLRLAALSLLSLMGIAVLGQSSGIQGAQPPERASLAILPFADLSANRGNSHFAEGVGEQILNMLSEEPGLRVAGRSSTAMLGARASFHEARERLGVTHLLEGSVRVQGRRLRMSVRLVRTSDGMQEWAEQFDRDINDVFAIQDEVGASVVSRLRGTLAANAAPRPRAIRTTGEVYDLYLAANQLTWDRTYEKMMEAQQLLRRAVAIDPSYAPAWARLAINASIIDQFRPTGMYQDSAADKARALQHARRALELQPGLADAHVALAMNIEENDPEAAAAAHERAIELDPGNFLAWNNLGNTYNRLCRPTEALASYRRAASIEPLLFVPHVNLVDLLSELGRNGEAASEMRRYLAASRDPLEAQRLPARLAYFQGDLSRAIFHGRHARTLKPDHPSISTFLAFSIDAIGFPADAARILPATQQQTLGNYWQGNYAAAAAQARPGSHDFWDQGTRFFAVSKSLVRTGQPARLLQLFDARFSSIEALDAEYRCALRG